MSLTATAKLIGEPARATMLDALLSGQALASGELARAAGVSPATASEHLARLLRGGLVEVVGQGRHRYYRLASPEVGHALEALSLIGSPAGRPIRSLRAAREDEAMRLARTCYDHLAGWLGVALHDALVTGGALRAGGDGYLLTGPGEQLLAGLGVPVAEARAARRNFARGCLDYTQRRPHLAGALGAALCGRLIELGWLVRRVPGQRALRLTDPGRLGLANTFALPPFSPSPIKE
jgi:DNA-binding transcriptional ArsR family regulator